MKRTAASLSLLVALFITGWAVAGEKPLVIDVWPAKPADDDAGKIGAEKFIDIKSVPGIKWLTNVTKPSLTVYRPAKERGTAAAALICPAGG
jgi:hypothetical protein